MKKLAIYSALMMSVLSMTGCDMKHNTNNPPRDHQPGTPPHQNPPPPSQG